MTTNTDTSVVSANAGVAMRLPLAKSTAGFWLPIAPPAKTGALPFTESVSPLPLMSVHVETTSATLRATVHLWADLSRRACVWAEAYYQKKKADGMNHTAALRCLGQRWVKILWKMWQTGTPYNEALHLKNQTRHGSWLIQLLPATPAKT